MLVYIKHLPKRLGRITISQQGQIVDANLLILPYFPFGQSPREGKELVSEHGRCHSALVLGTGTMGTSWERCPPSGTEWGELEIQAQH